jgi:hypothetical protein
LEKPNHKPATATTTTKPNQTKKQTNNQQPNTQPDYYLVVVGPRVVKVNHVGPLLAVGGEHVGGTHPVPGKGQEENSLPLKMDSKKRGFRNERRVVDFFFNACF